jgi:hypothetical protein
LILMGFAPLGALVASLLATTAAPGAPLAIGGAVCVLAAFGFIRWSREGNAA